jgi:hypothetical protein
VANSLPGSRISHATLTISSPASAAKIARCSGKLALRSARSAASQVQSSFQISVCSAPIRSKSAGSPTSRMRTPAGSSGSSVSSSASPITTVSASPGTKPAAVSREVKSAGSS